MASSWIFQFVCIMILIMLSPTAIMGDTVDIGVVYHMLADNLPSPPEIINLYKKYGIAKMRLYNPNPGILEALRGSKIAVSFLDFAKVWYSKYVEPYLNDVEFSYIIVGNEAIPGIHGQYVVHAMKNLQVILDYNNLGGISVTTAVSTKVLQYQIPPSAAVFTPEALDGGLEKVLFFLQNIRSYVLMINVYPYDHYMADPEEIRLDFALFTAKSPVIIEDEFNYTNLYDATIDAFYWAMERAGKPDVDLAVSETGWPTAGNGNLTTPELAFTYNKNILQHTVSHVGTPKRPGAYIEAFINGMFDENLEPIKQRQKFGIFKPNMEPACALFTPTANRHFKAVQRVGRKKNRRA